MLMGAAALFGAEYVDTPPRQTAGNALNLGFVRVWRRTVNEQGGRRKNHEIGVSEFSSGEHPPGIVVCSKGYVSVARCGT